MDRIDSPSADMCFATGANSGFEQTVRQRQLAEPPRVGLRFALNAAPPSLFLAQ
jgi:hypothetical protein